MDIKFPYAVTCRLGDSNSNKAMIDLNEAIDWCRDRNMTNFSFGVQPFYSNGSTTWRGVVKFQDPDHAMIFKLTWG